MKISIRKVDFQRSKPDWKYLQYTLHISLNSLFQKPSLQKNVAGMLKNCNDSCYTPVCQTTNSHSIFQWPLFIIIVWYTGVFHFTVAPKTGSVSILIGSRDYTSTTIKDEVKKAEMTKPNFVNNEKFHKISKLHKNIFFMGGGPITEFVGDWVSV